MPYYIEILDQTGPASGLIHAQRDQVFASAKSYSANTTLEHASGDDAGLAQYFIALQATLVKNAYSKDEMKDASRKAMKLFSYDAEASNYDRMSFLRISAIKALRLAYGVTEGNTLAEISDNGKKAPPDLFKLKAGLEALRAAAYFGCGEACQALIQANEWNILPQDAAAICDLVSVQIFWHLKSFELSNLKFAQQLPQLIENPKAWAAVRQDAALYQEVLRVVYLDSGVECQKLIDANEAGTIILADEELQALVETQLDRYVAGDAAQQLPTLLQNLKAWAAVRKVPELYSRVLEMVYHPSGVKCQELIVANEKGKVSLRPEEIRALVKMQMDQYLASKIESTVASQYPQQVPVLLKEMKNGKLAYPKTWAAMQEAPKESYGRLLNFFEALTLELPNAALIASPEALALTAENNPMVYKGYIEDAQSQVAIQSSALSTEEKVHMQDRERVLKAMFALRHQVFGFALKEVNAMRPAIEKKIESNAAADLESKSKVEAEERRLADVDAKDLENNPDPLKTIKYIGEGTSGLLDTSKGKTLFDTREDFDNKLAKARKKNNAKDISRYDTRLQIAKGAYALYLVRQGEREQGLQAFKNTEMEAAAVRSNELTSLQNQEQQLIKVLVESNPITECIRLAFLAYAQDLVTYGMPTVDWLMFIANSLSEDLKAYEAGTFAFKNPGKGKESRESLPMLIAANASAYMALLKLRMSSSDPKSFISHLQDQLFAADGRVTPVSVDEFVNDKGTFCVTRKPNELANLMQMLNEKYTVQGHVDPLLDMLNTNMLLALVISIKQIFPSHDAKYSDVIEQASISCKRLNKIISRPFSGDPSRLRNYIGIALVTMQDKSAVARLLLTNQSNPFYGVLLSANLIRQDDFSFISGGAEELVRVRIALEQVANATEHRVTATSINDSYIILSYLKKYLQVKALINSSEKQKTSQEIENAFYEQMMVRADNGKESDVDFLLLECFDSYISAKYFEFCELAGGKGALKIHDSAWTHTSNAKVMRKLRADRAQSSNGGAVRRSSLANDTSFQLPLRVSPETVEEPVPVTSLLPTPTPTPLPAPAVAAAPPLPVAPPPPPPPPPPRAMFTAPQRPVSGSPETVEEPVPLTSLFSPSPVASMTPARAMFTAPPPPPLPRPVRSASPAMVEEPVSDEEFVYQSEGEQSLPFDLADMNFSSDAVAVSMSPPSASPVVSDAGSPVEALMAEENEYSEDEQAGPRWTSNGVPSFLGGLGSHKLKSAGTAVVKEDGHMSVTIQKSSVINAGGLMGFLAQNMADRRESQKPEERSRTPSPRSSNEWD